MRIQAVAETALSPQECQGSCKQPTPSQTSLLVSPSTAFLQLFPLCRVGIVTPTFLEGLEAGKEKHCQGKVHDILRGTSAPLN